jgi:integrase
MPAVKAKVPKYCLMKASGKSRPNNLAYVRIDGRVRYLGQHGTPESLAEYARVVEEFRQALERREAEAAALPAAIVESPDRKADPEITIIELCAEYLDYAHEYYKKGGQNTSEVNNVKRAIRLVDRLYGETRAADFGPLSLRACQGAMERDAKNFTRGTINETIGTVKRMFRWAVSMELMPVTVYQALSTVPGLRRGRTQAREPQPVGPVDQADVERTLPFLPPIVADMVRLQQLTGMRPGEVCQLRPECIERDGRVWTYRPSSFKTEHHDGARRVVFIGPQAQVILTPYLLRPADAWCFSPIESEEQRHVELRAKRKSPVQPSQQNRRKPRPRRAPRDHYTPDTYRRAITRAVELVNDKEEKAAAKLCLVAKPIAAWTPNQLRHSAATRIRRDYGLESAQTVLGHSRADVTEIYAERDFAKAREIMERIG